MSFSLPYKQWQTARVITSAATEDTLLTDYKPSDVTTLDASGKMISVHPATAVMLRAWGTNTDNDTCTLTVSGWFRQPSQGGSNLFSPGQRLWKGTLTLGAKSMASTIPIEDGKWPSATWFEVDTWTATSDPTGATSIATADHASVLLLPTLGYSHLMFEITDKDGTSTEMSTVGIAWYPIRFQELVKTF